MATWTPPSRELRVATAEQLEELARRLRAEDPPDLPLLDIDIDSDVTFHEDSPGVFTEVAEKVTVTLGWENPEDWRVWAAKRSAGDTPR